MSEIILDKGSKRFSYVTESAESEHIVLIDCRAKISNIFAKNLSEKETAVFGDYDIYMFYKYKINQKRFVYKTTVMRKQFSEIINVEKNEKVSKSDENAKAETLITFEPSCRFGIKSKHIYTSSWQIEVFGDMEVKHIINLPPPAGKEPKNETPKPCKEETGRQAANPPSIEVPEVCNNEYNKNEKSLSNVENPKDCKEAADKKVITPLKIKTSETGSEEANEQIAAPVYVKTSPEVIESDKDEVFYFYGDGEYSIEDLMNMDLDTLRKIAGSNKHSQ